MDWLKIFIVIFLSQCFILYTLRYYPEKDFMVSGSNIASQSINNIIMENRDSEISAPSRDDIYSGEKNTDDSERKRITRIIEQVYSENIKLRQLLRKNDETIKYLAGLTDSYPSDSVIIERYNLDIETFFTRKIGDYSFKIPFKKYYKYRIGSEHLSPNLTDFIDITPEIIEYIHYINITEKSREGVVEKIIETIKEFDYLEDRDEFFKYPLETIVDGNGDCEDLSILASAFFVAAGFDTILIISPGHVQVGVAIDNEKQDGIEFNGKKYTVIETTDKNYVIGETSNPEFYYIQKIDIKK